MSSSLEEEEAAASRLPLELLSHICEELYSTLSPSTPAFPNPDPHVELDDPLAPSHNAHFSPTPAQAVPVIFRNLSLVNRAWRHEAKRWLWLTLSFGMPRGFESVLRTIEEYRIGHTLPLSLREWAARNAAEQQARDGDHLRGDDGARGRPRTLLALDDGKWSRMAGSGRKDGLMLHDPNVPDRSPSSDRHAQQEPIPLDPSDSPVLLTRILSFARFRTAGMGRTVRQGSHERFVTPYRLKTLLKGTRSEGPLILPGDDERMDVSEDGPALGRLEAVGFTEFMDSAISLDVLEEMLFRGGYLAEYEDLHVEGHNHAFGGHESDAPDRNPFDLSFVARELQSSHSRSPGRPPELIHEDSAEEEHDDDEGEEVESDAESEVVPNRPAESPERPRGRRPLMPSRRPSGSAFRIGSSETPTREESEERGRSRPRLGRSLLPPSSLATRSSSVPAAYLQRRQLSRSYSVSRPSHHERSSSVPAAGGAPHAQKHVKTVVHVLEGSRRVRAIRAIDLCGCVSGTFVAALADLISTHQLGPVGMFEASSSAISAIAETSDGSEAGSDDEMDGVHPNHAVPERSLRRVFFPHLRRLGLASALVPSPHLTAFVLSFPFLTHLDLTSTLATPALLFGLASAGKTGLGGRKMRLQGLSFARCRLLTGDALVGLFCGDCPPFTSHPTYGTGDDQNDHTWGRGDVVSELVDLSLFGDVTSPSPLTNAELRLILVHSPAFLSTRLRSLDLSSTPLTDDLLATHFPPQPNLIELGLANCRDITMSAVSDLLINKAPSVEVLDLSFSCPIVAPRVALLQLHSDLLGQAASTRLSSWDLEEARQEVSRRRTNLRVVELDEKALDTVKGGAGDWKPIWGKGRRGWYVDLAVASRPSTIASSGRPRELYHLPRDSPRRKGLQRLASLNGVVDGAVGWRSRKMEVLRGDGMMGREEGLYVFHAYQV